MHLPRAWCVVLVLAGCPSEEPINKLPDAPIAIDAAPDAPPRTCLPVTGAGSVHNSSITTAETWTEAGNPHIIMFDTTVAAAVTIEECVLVRIAGGRTVTINSVGSITANGLRYDLRVMIERLDPATAFGPIRAIGGVLSLTTTYINGGGNPLGPAQLGATIIMQRSASATTGSFHANELFILNSASNGVLLTGVAGFDATSADVVVADAVGRSVVTAPNLVGSLPRIVNSGTTTNEIMIDDSGGQITTSQTMHNYGIPYIVGDEPGSTLDVVSFTGNVPVLTIEPGVVLKFHPQGRLRIDTAGGNTNPAKGALVAVGSAAMPIRFTSVAATPAAGDWHGIYFSGEMNAATRMDYTRVEYAGGSSATGSNSCTYAPGRVGQNDAAIRIFGTPQPLTQFITNTVIMASGRDGIDRGWANDLPLDFAPTNQFLNLGPLGCTQSLPRPTSTACPVPPPCPPGN